MKIHTTTSSSSSSCSVCFTSCLLFALLCLACAHSHPFIVHNIVNIRVCAWEQNQCVYTEHTIYNEFYYLDSYLHTSTHTHPYRIFRQFSKRERERERDFGSVHAVHKHRHRHRHRQTQAQAQARMHTQIGLQPLYGCFRPTRTCVSRCVSVYLCVCVSNYWVCVCVDVWNFSESQLLLV